MRSNAASTRAARVEDQCCAIMPQWRRRFRPAATAPRAPDARPARARRVPALFELPLLAFARKKGHLATQPPPRSIDRRFPAQSLLCTWMLLYRGTVSQRIIV